MELKKHNIYYAVFIGTLIAMGPFIVWRVFLQQLPVTGTGEATLSTRFIEHENTQKTLGNPKQARLRELSTNPSTALFVDYNRGMIYMYEKNTGLSFSINTVTMKVLPLSEKRLIGFVDTIWSPNGKEVISLFTQKKHSEFRYYNFNSKQVSLLDPTTSKVAFSPDGTSIVTTRDLSDMTQLWISKPDGSADWLLMASRALIKKIWWPSQDNIAILTRRPNGNDDLSLINLDSKLQTILEKRNALEVSWNRSGEKALISSEDENGNNELEILNTITGQITPLGLKTRASKCIWQGQGLEITCGINPSSVTSRDTVVSINTDGTKMKTRFEAQDDVWVSIVNPLSLPRDNGMVFINLYDERPYILTW